MPASRFRFDVSSACSAFQIETIGTKVIASEDFRSLLWLALGAHDPSRDRKPGQHYIVLPREANATVSAGVGRRRPDPARYVLRCHRGRVSAYLQRGCAEAVESVAVVVYTREAYLADPDVLADHAEAARIGSEVTHVVVAVLASAGPPSPLTPFRLVANLAGGNNEALEWTADEIRTKARESAAYADAWDVVAD
ncbi:MAG: hypothetical protein Q8Q85_01595 [Gemmatimonadales bacterium]|nr:hypothetical protein [Gemmatimonadales bacterium]